MMNSIIYKPNDIFLDIDKDKIFNSINFPNFKKQIFDTYCIFSSDTTHFFLTEAGFLDMFSENFIDAEVKEIKDTVEKIFKEQIKSFELRLDKPDDEIKKYKLSKLGLKWVKSIEIKKGIHKGYIKLFDDEGLEHVYLKASDVINGDIVLNPDFNPDDYANDEKYMIEYIGLFLNDKMVEEEN